MILNNIPLFRTIDSLKDKPQYSETGLTATYFFGESENRLEAETSGNIIKFSDIGFWNISEHGLILRKTVSLDNISALFGDNGVADKNSVLGIAIIISSLQSNRTEVFTVAEFGSYDSSVKKNCEVVLREGNYREEFTEKTVLFLKKNGGGRRRGFASIVGTILGTLNEIKILTSEIQLFPVLEVNVPGEPLWWVKCDWSDAVEDLFDQSNVCLFLNKNNNNYNLIDIESDKKCMPYFADVISSALQIILEKAMKNPEEWKKICTDPNLPEGSVAFVLRYFIYTFEWNTSTPELLAKSIRNDIYSKMEKV